MSAGVARTVLAVAMAAVVSAQWSCDLSAAEEAAVQSLSPPIGSDLYAEINAASKKIAASSSPKRLRVTLAEGDYKMSCDVGGPLLEGDATGSLAWLEVRGVRNKVHISSSGSCPTAMKKRRLFTANNHTCLKLEGLSLSGGSADQYLAKDYPGLGGEFGGDTNWGGAVLFNNYSAGVLSDVEVMGNSANDGGGIAVFYETNVSISDSVLSTNHASASSESGGAGGGLLVFGYPSSNPIVRLIRVHFLRNIAKSYGGGAYSQYSFLKTDDLIFRDNFALQEGGGLSVYPLGYTLTPPLGFVPPQELSNIMIENNTAGGSGGGLQYAAVIQNSYSVYTVNNVTVKSNSAPKAGGIIAYTNVPHAEGLNPFGLVLQNSLVESNVATKDNGGGIVFLSGDFTVENTTVRNNTAKTKGGGLSIETMPEVGSVNTTKFALRNATVVANTAGDRLAESSSTEIGFGGGISVEALSVGPTVNLGFNACPTPHGAGLGLDAPTGNCTTGQPWTSTNTFTCDCSPIENEFPSWLYSIHAEVTSSNISKNTASFGGGLAVNNAHMIMVDSTIEWNLGVRGGGGMYLSTGSASTELHDMTFQNNLGQDSDTLGLNIQVRGFKSTSIHQYTSAILSSRPQQHTNSRPANQQMSSGSLSFSGASKLSLGGNSSEIYTAVGAGQISISPETQFQCPIGYNFNSGTKLADPYPIRFQGLWSLNCNNPSCEKQCEPFTNDKNCAPTNTSCWNSIPKRWDYLDCMALCHPPECSANCTGCTVPFRGNVTKAAMGSVNTFSWAYYSSCQFCANANSIQPQMLTQFLQAGCAKCPPKSYSLQTSNMTRDAETGRLHIDQATCLSCPENGDCQGGPTISNRQGYYALLTEGPVKPVAFDQTLKLDDPQRLVGLLRVL
jgi:hypothetical protein